jgi:N-acetylmuramoyl-L-alanine amidase
VPVTPAPAAVSSGLGVVVIDAGHQAYGNSALEPEGPGSKTMKPKVESGASGVATHVDESQRNLEVALVLQRALQARGVTVVMVRTTQNVNIPNSQRAQIANNAHAALFIRLHCDSGPSSTTGILTLEPAKNWYTDHPIVAKSAVAAKLVHNATLAATGAHDRGITPRSDLSGFNWSQVPSVLVEMGMMSNAGEDRKMATPAYQQELADGMANGIVAFLKTN